MDARSSTVASTRHPALDAFEGADRAGAAAFAWDMASWFHGAPRGELAALARVVTALLEPDLISVRAACQRSALMSVEAGVRAALVLWPLLRDQASDEEDPPGPEDAGDAEDSGDSGDGESVSETREDDGEESESEDPESEDSDDDGEDGEEDEEDASDGAADRLKDLADGMDVDDPDLDALANLLRADDGGEESLEQVSTAAWGGAMRAEALSRAMDRLVPGVGWGAASGALEEAVLKDLHTLADLLERLPELAKLADMLGRAEAEGRKAGHGEGGSEEVVGVRVGGEVRLALPSELGMLGDPATEDLFYMRFTERRLVSLELSGQGMDGVARPEKRGPVIACIDTSGSMSGPPEVMAKALVLAVCRKALPAGRAVHLLQFGSSDQLSEVRLRSGHAGLPAFLQFLSRGFRGGTDFDTPLLRALDLLDDQELKNADIVVVTDGLAAANDTVVSRVADVRAAQGLRVWSVLINASSTLGVERFSDHIWHLDADDLASVRLMSSVVKHIDDEPPFL